MNSASATSVPPVLPLQEKWGESLRQGFVVVPWVLMRRQRDLDLDANELVVLLHLVASWWDPKSAPFPSSQAIAARMNVSPRTVQRCLKTLQEKRLIERQPGQQGIEPNAMVTRYSLEPLTVRLSQIVTTQIKVAREAVREGETNSTPL